ncbi:hypothetical protein PHYPSEUDO_010998 [Phytophthora pseudosyringae]|uniref:Transmembrane protein n=1 Tax=Phytophthora pseudosyringae TaxID=221518 RepID=A0A8T1W759_9STRA|nr:hypothetical protein PHYPSEUDO_010998 [Phytophthora pseudosyringae]
MGSSLTFWGVKLLRAWKRLQVSYYGGKYSVHRVLALETYTRKTPWWRVLLVCFGTPLPMAALVLAQELVPLQDPSDGWSSNYGFWVRTSILVFVGIPTLTVQATYFIDGVTIPAIRLFLLSFFSSVSVIVCSMAICAHLIFPVPFFLLAMFPVLSVVLTVSFRVIIGTRIIHQILANRGQLTRYLHFVNAKCLLIFIYPAYEALFHAAHGTHYQLLVILLLPAMKIALKNTMRRRTTHMEDMTPEAVIFTVDLFNSIYMATCMQSASSPMTVTVITVIDLSLTIIMLYGLRHRTATVLVRLRDGVGKDQESDNLLSALCKLCRDPEKFSKQVRGEIQIYSCLPYSLSVEDERLMALLDKIPTNTTSKVDPIQDLSASATSPSVAVKLSRANISKLQPKFFQSRNGTIYPLIPDVDSLTSSASKGAIRPNVSSVPISCPKSSPLLRDSLETLFTMECLTIASYLEAVIPLFYASYTLVIVHLPNARYHTEIVGITPGNVGATVLPVFVFAFLQVVSIVLLAALVKRNCGMQALYQLAFVLETQMPLVQGKLMFWMLVTLCFRLVHFGVDFTFQFVRV